MKNLTRSVTVGIKLEILDAIPPIMEIECADPLLCLVGEGGKLFINPSSWLALRAGCTTQVSPAALWTVMTSVARAGLSVPDCGTSGVCWSSQPSLWSPLSAWAAAPPPGSWSAVRTPPSRTCSSRFGKMFLDS